MKRQITYFTLVTLTTFLAFWLPIDARKVVEGGQPRPSVELAVAKPLNKPATADLSHLEPVNVPAPVSAPIAAPAASVSVSTYSGSGDQYLDWIIQHESSGNPYAINEIGACGLFQALPCSKMGCSLSDVGCQLAWGRNYAVSRYGSTYAAMLFWQSNRWW